MTNLKVGGQEELLPGEGSKPAAFRAALMGRFMFPPFTVWDARSGPWNARKRDWLALGIKSEIGRAQGLVGNGPGNTAEQAASIALRYGIGEGQLAAGGRGVYTASTSVFDPVVCELVYRWWCPPGGKVLDPYAGGSVRGVVAAYCGLAYHGIELRREQIEANRTQADDIIGPGAGAAGYGPLPRWYEGDARGAAALTGAAGPFDMIFTCPPYGDLERYSDDPRDLSTLEWPEFLEAYADIIRATCRSLLAPGGIAVYVVGDFRDGKGALRGFPGATVDAFKAAGMEYYNDAILATPLGTAPVRTSHAFGRGGKLGRVHQHVLVFRKDAQTALALGEVGAPTA